VSGGMTVIEVAHTNAMGPKGLGQKATDFSAIPLCSGLSGQHRENLNSYHRLGEKTFSRRHGIDFRELVRRLQIRISQQGRVLFCSSGAGGVSGGPESPIR
jgi:hypothetical protein